jgi:hypothetical protein
MILTGVLLGTIYGLAVGIRNLGFIFNIVGAVASNSIGFILPAFFVWMLSRQQDKNDKLALLGKIVFVVAVPLGLFCVACEIIATASH